MRRSASIVCLMVALAAAGCTHGVFTKSELFPEYGRNGEANYYRVTLDGSGFNGEIDYREGWYDAQAVDELFGAVGDDHLARQAIAKRRDEVIQKTYDAYADALEENRQGDIAVRRANYEAALSSASPGAPRTGGEATDRSDKKFVMILSCDPDRIIDAIKGKIRERKVADSVAALVTASRDQEDAGDVLRLQLLEGRIARVIEALRSAEASLGDETAADAARARLNQLVLELEALR